MTRSDNKLVVYVHDKCIPCRRLLRFLEKLGVKNVIILDAKDNAESIKLLTGGRTLVPVIFNPSNGKVLIGCPTSLDEFKEKLKSILET